mmetsp:Transcript_12964/g.19948  ORF Transcript_12964/g.19948 Transcript_12964/m.19948 type:complete len:90 (+) Transcript_12964:363-632(+)
MCAHNKNAAQQPSDSPKSPGFLSSLSRKVNSIFKKTDAPALSPEAATPRREGPPVSNGETVESPPESDRSESSPRRRYSARRSNLIRYL